MLLRNWLVGPALLCSAIAGTAAVRITNSETTQPLDNAAMERALRRFMNSPVDGNLPRRIPRLPTPRFETQANVCSIPLLELPHPPGRVDRMGPQPAPHPDRNQIAPPAPPCPTRQRGMAPKFSLPPPK